MSRTGGGIVKISPEGWANIPRDLFFQPSGDILTIPPICEGHDDFILFCFLKKKDVDLSHIFQTM